MPYRPGTVYLIDKRHTAQVRGSARGFHSSMKFRCTLSRLRIAEYPQGARDAPEQPPVVNRPRNIGLHVEHGTRCVFADLSISFYRGRGRRAGAPPTKKNNFIK